MQPIHSSARGSAQLGQDRASSVAASTGTSGLQGASDAKAPSGIVLATPALSSHGAFQASHAQPLPLPLKRRRLGRFIYTGLPKPVPKNAAWDAVSPAVVSTPDPIAGSSSRNAAPLQDVPPCTQACSASSSQAKSSPEVHLLGNAAANSIALPNVLSFTEGQPELQVSSASPAGFIIFPKPQPAGPFTPHLPHPVLTQS